MTREQRLDRFRSLTARAIQSIHERAAVDRQVLLQRRQHRTLVVAVHHFRKGAVRQGGIRRGEQIVVVDVHRIEAADDSGPMDTDAL